MEYDIQRMLKHRKPLGNGIDRIAYFCPEYNIVIKRSLGFELGRDSFQSKNEMDLFALLTEEEKKCFAFVAFVKYADIIHVIMRRVFIIEEFFPSHFSSYELFEEKKIIAMCARLGYGNIHYDEFMATMMKYNVHDLHSANVGLDETGRLVAIDAGIASH